jgi:hypothetical protein
MLFSDDDLKTTFEIPDEPTYLQSLRYESEVSMHPKSETFERLWLGACILIQNWKSEIIPQASPEILNQKSTPDGIMVLKWAGLSVWSVMWDQKQIEKK